MSLRSDLEKLLESKQSDVDAIKVVLSMLPLHHAAKVTRKKEGPTNVDKVLIAVHAHPNGITPKDLAAVVGIPLRNVYTPIHLLTQRKQVKKGKDGKVFPCENKTKP